MLGGLRTIAFRGLGDGSWEIFSRRYRHKLRGLFVVPGRFQCGSSETHHSINNTYICVCVYVYKYIIYIHIIRVLGPLPKVLLASVQAKAS